MIFCISFFVADLVPVSSTVIPLSSYQVNATGVTEHHHALSLSEEYRIAYLKHLIKKANQTKDDPDTLITCNSNGFSKLFFLNFK